MTLGVWMPDVLARTMVTDACWLWLGSRSTKGYGQIVRDGQHLQVHRIAYESAHGPIPEGFVVDHACHNPAVCAGGTCVHRVCVNPDHLRVLTNAENASRQTPAAKTHCVANHELSGENLGRTSAGHRFCRECQRRQSLEWRERQFTVAPSRIRHWAVLQGMDVGVRGALAKSVIAAWDAAHPGNPYRVLSNDGQRLAS